MNIGQSPAGTGKQQRGDWTLSHCYLRDTVSRLEFTFNPPLRAALRGRRFKNKTKMTTGPSNVTSKSIARPHVCRSHDPDPGTYRVTRYLSILRVSDDNMLDDQHEYKLQPYCKALMNV